VQDRSSQSFSQYAQSNLRMLVFLQTHWGQKYDIKKPTSSESKWSATALFGPNDQLFEDNPYDLLERMRHHWHHWQVIGGGQPI
jgi:hypothetical protein